MDKFRAVWEKVDAALFQILRHTVAVFVIPCRAVNAPLILQLRAAQIPLGCGSAVFFQPFSVIITPGQIPHGAGVVQLCGPAVLINRPLPALTDALSALETPAQVRHPHALSCRCSLSIPGHRLFPVLLHAVAALIAIADVRHSCANAILRSLAEPAGGPRPVLLYAVAVFIAYT